MGDFLDWLPINDDVEAEFYYWAGELRAAVVKAAAFAGFTGLAIAIVPGAAADDAGIGFAKSYWPHLVEVAFWLGLLVGLLWGAAKRFGAALAGSQPWREPARCGEREATARFFGQWGMFAALAGLALWMAHEITAVATGGGPAALFTGAFAPLWAACFLSAAAFLLVACLGRRRRSSKPPGRDPKISP